MSEESKPGDSGNIIQAKERVIAAIKTCYDPEIPVDVYELGLIYDVTVDPSMAVEITMTLTSPSCPVAESLPGDVEAKVAAVEGISSAHVELTWEPEWTVEMMSEAARLELNL